MFKINFLLRSMVTLRDLRFSGRWRFMSRSSGLWHRVAMWQGTNVSEDCAASIFRAELTN